MPIQFDLVDIKLLVKIAETNSLTQGARHSYMSVPAASVRVKHVEERLGAKLLHRTSQGVSLTPAGQVFLRHGRLVLQQLELLQDDLRKHAEGVKGNLRIFVDSVFAGFLSDALCGYLAAHRGVTIELRERMSSGIVGMVRDGTAADIGIITDDVRTDDLETLPYARERLVLAVAFNHPLAPKKNISFCESLPFDHVALPESGAIPVLLDKAAQGACQPLKTRVRVGNCEALCRIVETNAAVGVLPESAARRYMKTMAIRSIELKDAWAGLDLHICVRNLASLPAFAKAFVKTLRAERPASIGSSLGIRPPGDLAGIHPISLARAPIQLASS